MLNRIVQKISYQEIEKQDISKKKKKKNNWMWILRYFDEHLRPNESTSFPLPLFFTMQVQWQSV